MTHQNTEDEAAALMLSRLQSQFGDLDLGNLLQGDDGTNIDENGSDGESSLEEPSAEELQAWQQTQFQKGKLALEVKKQRHMTPLERRRRQARQNRSQEIDDDDDDEWERLAALPELAEASVFFPSTDDKGNEILGVHPLLEQLARGDSDVLGTKWQRLLSSQDGDGLSLMKLLATLQGYEGPTVILIGCLPSVSRSLPDTTTTNQASPSTTTSTTTTTTTTNTIGFYTTSPWIESEESFGSSDCFLFGFRGDERVEIVRPVESKGKATRKYIYCHPSTKAAGHRSLQSTTKSDGAINGIGVGGTPSQPRLHLTETLEECRFLGYDALFEPGDLLGFSESLNYFDVDCIEVWGVGGDEWIQASLEQQKRHRMLRQANLTRARTIDKKQLLKDVRLGGLLSAKPTALFDHVQHTTGRCDL